MAKNLNRVELIGNLTADPELKYTPNGIAVNSFTVATNRTYTTDGEKKEQSDFHRIVCWNKLAELASQLLVKGSKVFVEGRLQNRNWEDKDGNKKTTTEIILNDFILVEKANGQEIQSNTKEEGESF